MLVVDENEEEELRATAELLPLGLTTTDDDVLRTALDAEDDGT